MKPLTKKQRKKLGEVIELVKLLPEDQPVSISKELFFAILKSLEIAEEKAWMYDDLNK